MKKSSTLKRCGLFSTKWIAYTAMLAALVIATSYIPYVPIPPFGNVYWCDGVIYLAAYLLDPVAALLVGGLGTLFYDLLLGNAAMALPSFLIHGLQGAAVSVLLHCVFPKKREEIWAVISSLVGAAIVIGGYFLLRVAIQGKGMEYALYRIVANICQSALGITVAMLICYASTLKPQLERAKLLPDFRREVLEKTEKKDD